MGKIRYLMKRIGYLALGSAVFSLALVSPAYAGTIVLDDSFSGLAVGSCYVDGQAFGNWSTTPGETHAALSTSQWSGQPSHMIAEFGTLQQLRQGSAPNPWEVAWFL
jgi:hypothetical protein